MALKAWSKAGQRQKTPDVPLRSDICERDQLSPQPASSRLSLISQTETRRPCKDPQWNVTSHETAIAASLPPPSHLFSPKRSCSDKRPVLTEGHDMQ